MKNQTSVHKKSHIAIGFSCLLLLVIGLLTFSKKQIEPVNVQHTNAGIDQFIHELEQAKGESSNLMASIKPSFSDASVDVKQVNQLYQQTTEELKADLLQTVRLTDRQNFQQELHTIFQVRQHQSFFQRQIDFCQLKLDLAVVGMGIIRVHEVLKGQNPTVQEKDQEAFVKYIRDQVQSAVASNDHNFKAIVFKGLESSSS